MVDTKSHISYIPDQTWEKTWTRRDFPLKIFEIVEILYLSYCIIYIFGSTTIWLKLISKEAPYLLAKLWNLSNCMNFGLPLYSFYMSQSPISICGKMIVFFVNGFSFTCAWHGTSITSYEHSLNLYCVISLHIEKEEKA